MPVEITMENLRHSPNPLRPYYRPPSIGLSQESRGSPSSGNCGLGSKNASASSYASSARDIFSDLDYTDYLSESSPSALDSFRKQIDEWFYRYVTILLAQPFDVAKTILQAKSQDLNERENPKVEDLGSQQSTYLESYKSDDSDQDETAYFTPNKPYSKSERHRRESRSQLPSPKTKPVPSYQLALKTSDSVLEVIGQEWAKEGALGVWKGSNTTFIYGILIETLEKWSRGLLSAIFNVPDPDLGSSLEIPVELLFNWTSLAVSVTAAVTASVILAPLDLARTKFIMTPLHKKRFSMSQQRPVYSYFCHPALLIPTALYSLVTPTIVHSTTLLLRAYMSIDPVLTPNAYQMAQLTSRLLELLIKLPFETVLRRAQMSILTQTFEKSKDSESVQGSLLTTVPIGKYRGVFGTMWLIVMEEGTTTPVSNQVKKRSLKARRGQGLAGLWRGWRVGMWGLVGVWGLRVFNGGGGSIGEF